jgi:hypothetical protein
MNDQLIIHIYESYSLGKDTFREIVFNGLIDTFATGFSLILSGKIAGTIIGLLMVLGLGYLIISGAWKIVVRPIFNLIIR